MGMFSSQGYTASSGLEDKPCILNPVFTMSVQELEAELYLDEADTLAQMDDEEQTSIMDAFQQGLLDKGLGPTAESSLN